MQPLFRETQMEIFMVGQTKTSGTGSGERQALDQGGNRGPRAQSSSPLLAHEFHWCPATSTCLYLRPLCAATTEARSCDRDRRPGKPQPLPLWSSPEKAHGPCITGRKGKQPLSRRPWEHHQQQPLWFHTCSSFLPTPPWCL